MTGTLWFAVTLMANVWLWTSLYHFLDINWSDWFHFPLTISSLAITFVSSWLVGDWVDKHYG